MELATSGWYRSRVVANYTFRVVLFCIYKFHLFFWNTYYVYFSNALKLRVSMTRQNNFSLLLVKILISNVLTIRCLQNCSSLVLLLACRGHCFPHTRPRYHIIMHFTHQQRQQKNIEYANNQQSTVKYATESNEAWPKYKLEVSDYTYWKREMRYDKSR